MVWLDEKARILAELADYITRVSNMDPIPIALLDELEQVEKYLQTANEREFIDEGYQAWWAAMSQRTATP